MYSRHRNSTHCGHVHDFHRVDDPDRLASMLREYHFDDWDSVLNFVIHKGLDPDDIMNDIAAADPDASPAARTGFLWGTVLALKASSVDPSVAALAITRGLKEFCLPRSTADTSCLAEGLGRLASLLLQRWTNGMAIVGSRIPSGYIELFREVARCAESLRHQKWDLLVLCKPNGFTGHMFGNREYISAEVQFSQADDYLRVVQSSVAGRSHGSLPVVYMAHTVEQGIAILEFEHANLCLALSEPEAALFAHPIVGTYARRARSSGRTVRTAAIEMPKTKEAGTDMISTVSAYMIGMYADFEVSNIERDAKAMEDVGFPGISGIGTVEAIMMLSQRVTNTLRQSQSPD